MTVSIHAPAWGATETANKEAKGYSRFNPRARVGRDARRDELDALCNGFNPRARVGRDPGAKSRVGRLMRFNPRARVGRDAS